MLGELADELRAHVRRHDDDGVLERHHAALAVGQTAVVQHLQQDVEHVRMRLLDLVEQDHRVGLAAHGLGQLAALVVAHVPRRRADQALHRELLHVLGHVDAHHGLLAVEQVLGQRLRELRLAHARGAQEQKRADGAVGVGEPGAVAADGAGHRGHGLVLAHHALVQLVLQVDQLGHLALHHLLHGNARPRGNDLGDLVVRHLLLEDGAVLLLHVQLFLGRMQLLLQRGNARVADLGGLHQVALAGGALLFKLRALEVALEVLHVLDGVLLVLPLGLALVEVLLSRGDLAAQRFQALLRGLVALLHERLLLDLHLGELALGGVHLLGHRVDLDAQAAGGLVHEVDGLVGQEAVGDVAVRQLGRRHDGGVGDAHAVVDLVLLLQTAQDGDGVLHRGLGDQHGLEAALERGVLLDVLAVLVQRGGADGMQLAAGQRGLQHVARVHGAVARGAGAHDGVQLVDEQDDASFALLHLAQHGLQTVLELAAVLRAGHHRAQVERNEIAVLQRRGHVAGHDALGQTFDDGRLAGARLTDEHGVVLRAARQHLDGAADLLGAADDRVELAFARLLREVLAVLLQRLELHFVLLVGDARVAAQLLVGSLDALARDAGRSEDLARGALLLGQRDQQMLAGGVAVAQLLGDLDGVVDEVHQGRARHAAHHAGVPADLRHALDLGIHVGLQLERLGTDALDDSGQVVLFRFQQSLQHVNGLCLR